MAHIGQKRTLEQVGLLGLLLGFDQFRLAVFQYIAQPLVLVVKEIDEHGNQRQQDQRSHAGIDHRTVLAQLGLGIIHHDTPGRKFVLGDIELFEFIGIETVLPVGQFEMYRTRLTVVITGNLPGDLACAAFVFGIVTADSHALQPCPGQRENRHRGILGDQVVHRAVHQVLAVIAYTPRPDQQSRMLRQARNPRNDGIAPLARIDLDQPQIVIAEHFAPHQRLERNAAVRVVRHESDITHIGIE